MALDNEQPKQKIRVRVPARGRGKAVAPPIPDSSPSTAASLCESSPSFQSQSPGGAEKLNLARSVGHKPGGDTPPASSIASSGLDASHSLRPPRGQSEDRARRLTFELEVGELPNVLQFISTDKRTGKLELTVQNQPNAGYVFFSDGEVYLARYRNYEGVEALARVVSMGRVRAVFTNDAKSAEKNINIPVSSLLLEVLVRADELAAENKEKPAQPPPRRHTFTMHPKGEHLPPPPVGETVPDKLISTFGVQSRQSGEKGVARGGGGSSPEKYETGIFSRLAVRVVELIILAGLLGGAYLAYERFDRLRNASPGQSTVNGGDRPVEDDLDFVKTWLGTAEKAIGAQKYDEAEKQIERVLTLEPSNTQALLLREIVDRENAPATAAKLVKIATGKMRQSALLKDREWARPQIENLEHLFEVGNRFLLEEDFRLAVGSYRELIAGADVLFNQRRAYQVAMDKQREAMAVKAKASQSVNMEYAGGLWAEAGAAEREAEKQFATNAFKEAAAAWGKAAAFYQRGATYSVEVADVAQLSRSFKILQAACEDVKLSERGKALVKQAEELAAAAEALARQGDLEQAKVKWRQAMGAQSNVSSIVDKDGNQRRYTDLIAKAQSFADKSDWNLARGAYSAALAVPGYENDTTALKGVGQADKGLLTQEMKIASGEGRWQDAKVAAEELLAIDPNNPAATEIMFQSKTNLIVSLNIQAVYDGLPVAGARAFIGGEPEIRVLPHTIGLVLDQNYHIRVWAPPRGKTYFETYTTVYEARKVGPDTLIVQMKATGNPEKTKPWRVPGVELDMAYIRPGIFSMGSESRRDEQPVHQVAITRYFWMSVGEVTNRQYRDFLTETGYDGKKSANSGYLRHFSGSSAMSDGDNYPICYVSWKNAMAFCEWLTNREREGDRLPGGYVYRLPTEAEWEYCARFGDRPRGVELDARGWYMKNSNANQPVRQLRANDAGLKDMLGNVWELCYDYYGRYNADEVADPVGPKRGVLRVMRGGSHANPAGLCQPTYRSSVGWTDARANVGFRIVLAPSIEELRKSMTPGPVVRSSSSE